MQWGCELLIEQLNGKSHVVLLATALMVASGIGAAILFGWGLDSNPVRMFKLWLGTAISGLICFVATDYGVFESMAVFTVMFTWMAYVAIYVLMLAYLSHHAKLCTIGTLSAWMSIWFIGQVLTTMSMKMIRSSIVNLFYLGSMTAISGVYVLTRPWRTDTMKNVPLSPTYRDRIE
jgi:hypothetical protein